MHRRAKHDATSTAQCVTQDSAERHEAHTVQHSTTCFRVLQRGVKHSLARKLRHSPSPTHLAASNQHASPQRQWLTGLHLHQLTPKRWYMLSSIYSNAPSGQVLTAIHDECATATQMTHSLPCGTAAHLTASIVPAGILQCSNARMPYKPNASCRVFPQMVSLKPTLLWALRYFTLRGISTKCRACCPNGCCSWSSSGCCCCSGCHSEGSKQCGCDSCCSGLAAGEGQPVAFCCAAARKLSGLLLLKGCGC